MSGGHRSAVVALLIGAALLRLHRLDDLPPGLYHDIGVNGLDALDVLAGHFPIFFARNFGREALFIYVQTLFVALGGFHPLVFNLAGVSFSMLSVALAYRLFRDWFGHEVAIGAAGLFAFSLWAVIVGRIGLRATVVPAFTLVSLLLLSRTLRDRRPAVTIASGVAAGLSLYTYLSARLIPFILAAFLLLSSRRAIAARRQIALAALVGGLTFLPEAAYFVLHRETLLQRATDVWVFNSRPEIEGEATTPSRAILNTAGMFAFVGDANRRHNIPGRPAFEWPVALLFGGGLLIATWRARSRPEYGLCLAWLGIGSLASALTHESPSSFRAFLVAPVAALFPAVAIEVVRRRLARWSVRLASAALGAILLLYGARTADLYFRVWGDHPDTYTAFNTHLTRIAALTETRPETHLVVAVDLRAPVQVLSPRARAGWWQREESVGIIVPETESGDVLYVSDPDASFPRVVPDSLPGVADLPFSRAPDYRPDFRAFVWREEDRRAFRRAFQVLNGEEQGEAFAVEAVSLRRDGLRAPRLDVLWRPNGAQGPFDLYTRLRDSPGGGARRGERPSCLATGLRRRHGLSRDDFFPDPRSSPGRLRLGDRRGPPLRRGSRTIAGGPDPRAVPYHRDPQ